MAKKKTGDLVEKKDGRWLLKNVRLSFPFLFKPDVQTGDDGKETKAYRTSLLLPKSTHRPVAEKLARIIKAMIEEEFGKGVTLGSDKKFLKDGDQGDTEDHKGHWVISVRESRRPTLVDRDRTPVTDEDEKLYAGAWVNVVIRPWAQNGKSMKKKTKFGKRINCAFDIVQFVDHDDPLAGSGRPDVDDVLDDIDEDDFDNDDGDGDGLDDI